MNRRKAIGIAVFILLFLSGVAGGYLYFSKVILSEKGPLEGAGIMNKSEDLFTLRMYYPVGDHLQIEERRLPRRILPMAIAEAVVEQYLKGPVDAKESDMPQDAKFLSLYRGADGVLYVDLSEEFRKNFRGDALTEFLVLKGLYQSIISNVEDIQDVKVLIEGKETETLGGHLYLLFPLKDIVSYEFKSSENIPQKQPATVFGRGGTGKL
jgi:Sporulation and spore germination